MSKSWQQTRKHQRSYSFSAVHLPEDTDRIFVCLARRVPEQGAFLVVWLKLIYIKPKIPLEDIKILHKTNILKAKCT